jgi:hypothetical protein
MSIDPAETAIVGAWLVSRGRVHPDDSARRIDELRKSHLIELARSADGWDILFRDPCDRRLWELTYPSSEMHGGGPPALTVISPDTAATKYGSGRI